MVAGAESSEDTEEEYFLYFLFFWILAEESLDIGDPKG
jgi:hypothetical protein